MGSVTLGVRLPNSGPFATADNIVQAAERVASFGYDTVWVHDHISWARSKLTHFATGSVEACSGQDPNFFESITTASILAGRLERIRVGIAGLVLPLRDPRVLAKQLVTVEQLTGSRLVVAFGIGAIEDDFAVMDVPFRRRGRITDDHLAALRAIIDSDQPVSYEGEHVSFANGTFFPQPASLPLWLTGMSDAAMRRTARFGDGWLTVYVSPKEYETAVRRLDDEVGAAGRSLDQLELAYETYVSVAPTHEEAVQIARASLEHKFTELGRGLQVCLVGDPNSVAEQISAYRDAGAQHLELKFICRDPSQLMDMIQLTAEEVKTLL